MAIKNVVTIGYGSFGGVNFIPTLGFGNFTVVAGPYRVDKKSVYSAGARRITVYLGGQYKQGMYEAGALRQGVSE